MIDDECPTVDDAAHAVAGEMTDAGVLVFRGGLREDAARWAAKVAVACRCPQEVREFQYDPLA